MRKPATLLLSALLIALMWIPGGPARKGTAAMLFTLSSDSFAAAGEIPMPLTRKHHG